MKKIALFAVAGLLTTATIVTATVRSEKKPVKKEVVAKKEVKERACSGAEKKRHCFFN
jgi:hypothetical protein